MSGLGITWKIWYGTRFGINHSGSRKLIFPLISNEWKRPAILCIFLLNIKFVYFLLFFMQCLFLHTVADGGKAGMVFCSLYTGTLCTCCANPGNNRRNFYTGLQPGINSLLRYCRDTSSNLMFCTIFAIIIRSELRSVIHHYFQQELVNICILNEHIKTYFS
jgi:hypothetical protein